MKIINSFVALSTSYFFLANSLLASTEKYPDEENYKKGIYAWQEGYANKENLIDGKNLKEAFFLIEKAANNKNPKAQYDLATLYEKGVGTIKNLGGYKHWCEEAAKQEFPLAYNELGVIHEFGIGVDKNIEEAIKYYTLAMNKGVAVAIKNLERILEEEEETRVAEKSMVSINKKDLIEDRVTNYEEKQKVREYFSLYQKEVSWKLRDLGIDEENIAKALKLDTNEVRQLLFSK
jgi:TPR repeat protein